MNSLYVLIGFLIFVTAGYFSVVRMLFKLQQTLQPGASHSIHWYPSKSAFKNFELLRLLGAGVLLIQLPSLSLLVYFGWGPALLWLLCYYMFIEVLLIFVWGDWLEAQNAATPNSHKQPHHSKLWLGLLLLLVSALVALFAVFVADLLNQDASLFFVVVGFLLSVQFLVHSRQSKEGNNKNTIVIALVSAAVFFSGILLSQKLGISIYGNWQLFPSITPWIRINNQTIIAIVIIAMAFRYLWLDQADNRSRDFRQFLLGCSGVLVAILSLSVIATIVVAQPELDAPLHNTEPQTEFMPSLMGFSLFLGFGFFAALINLLALSKKSIRHSLVRNDLAESTAPRTRHFRDLIHVSTLINLLLAVGIVLLLAAAVGIGAWETHYQIWEDGSNIAEHLSLGVRSLSHTLGASKLDPTPWLQKTVTLATVLLALVAVLFWSWAGNEAQAALSKTSPKQWFSNQQHWLGLSLVTISSLLAFWLIEYGMSRQFWLLLGSITWFLCLDFLINHWHRSRYHLLMSKIVATACTILIVAGLMQLSYLIAMTSLQGKFGFTLAFAFVFLAAAWSWQSKARALSRAMLAKSPQRRLFKQN